MPGLDLLALHLLGDFILQTDTMARHKLTNGWIRAAHVFLYTMSFFLWGGWHYGGDGLLFAACVGVTHFAIDSYRFAANHPWPPKSILIDQSLHVISLALLARLFL